MPNYITKSGVNDDLNGNMVTDTDAAGKVTVTSYSSDNWPPPATVTITMLGGPDLHFKVSFTEGKSTKKYEISKAKLDNAGRDYKGDSSEVPLESGADWGTDDWTGTETGPEPTSY